MHPVGLDLDQLTAAVARTFGWTRRGTAVQARLDRAVEQAARAGTIAVDGGRVTAVAHDGPAPDRA